ncbi:MAG: hypothetical protein J0H17_18510 [Rhizobiales bacterium]|nr:hypothetical protein [Hyphomicrobiales bacterium]
MRLLRALIHLVLAVALIGAVPMPVALSAPAACDHHSADHPGKTDGHADDHSGHHGDRNAHAGHHAGMNHHASVQAADAAHPHSAPASAPAHKWNCCQTICCFVPSQLTTASEASAVTFVRTVRYGNLADRALGRTETPEPGIPKAAG